MSLRLTAVLTALALALVSIAPSPAFARDRRDGYRGHDGYYSNNYYRGHRGYRRHDDGDAVAAGVIGLVLGVALGAALSEPSPRRAGCGANYQNCGNPPSQGYYNQSYQQQSYAPAPYDDRRSAYEQDYGSAPAYADNPTPVYREGNACTRSVQQWDPYSGQYVWVNLRTPC